MGPMERGDGAEGEEGAAAGEVRRVVTIADGSAGSALAGRGAALGGGGAGSGKGLLQPDSASVSFRLLCYIPVYYA